MASPATRSMDAGIYNVVRPSYSAATVQLVKLLMEETRVPKVQQRLFERCLRSGQPLSAVRGRPGRGGRLAPSASARTHAASGRRSRDTIVRLETDGDPFPVYRPKPGRDRDAERERLAYLMAHGRQQPGEDGPAPEEAKSPPPEDRFEELWHEVEERRQFLSEMRQLGHEEKYEPIIRGELVRLVQEIEELQRQDAGGAEP